MVSLNMQRTPVGTGMILLGLDDGSKQVRLDAEVYTPQGLLVTDRRAAPQSPVCSPVHRFRSVAATR